MLHEEIVAIGRTYQTIDMRENCLYGPGRLFFLPRTGRLSSDLPNQLRNVSRVPPFLPSGGCSGKARRNLRDAFSFSQLFFTLSTRYSFLMHSIIPYDSNPTLRQKAQDIPLKNISGKAIQSLIADMKALLEKEEYGVALAAPQVGESLRLFVVSPNALERRGRKYGNNGEETPGMGETVYINPVIEKMSRGKTLKHEGCLSVRGKWGMVPRTEKITLTAYNERGEKFTRGASGLLAHIFQHEMDHLEGILYIDKANEVLDDKPS